jgi:cytochrome c-type biogenesis protein CcmH
MQYRSILLFPTVACIAAITWAGPAENDATRRIQERFVAPCCWQENLALHQSPAADEMRAEVSSLVQSGKSESEIVDYYVARYGERILREPRGSVGTWLKVTPVLAFALAALWLAWFVRRSAHRSRSLTMATGRHAPAPDDDFGW